MWDGDKVEILEVPGHVVIQGKASFGIKLNEKTRVSWDLDGSITTDVDFRNNGIITPLSPEDGDELTFEDVSTLCFSAFLFPLLLGHHVLTTSSSCRL